MKNPILALAVFSSLFLSACVGPTVLHETARTVGQNHAEFDGGLGSTGYVFKLNYGVTENFDIGVHWESLNMGVRAKYAFINGKDHEMSLAGAAGIGTTFGGTAYYGDVIASYLNGSWEPYGAFRYVHVSVNRQDFIDHDTGHVDFTFPGLEYSYEEIMIGSRFWLNKHWLFSLEAGSLIALGDLNIGNNLLVSGVFGYHF